MDRDRNSDERQSLHPIYSGVEAVGLVRIWQNASLAEGFTLEWTLDQLERSKELRS